MAIALATFGCRLNLVEGETIRAHAAAAGLADVAVVNGCAVTAEAVRQAAQQVRRFHRERPDRPVIVTGCAGQIESARFAAMPEVAHVLGNAEKVSADSWRALAASNSLRAGEPASVAIGRLATERSLSPQPSPRGTHQTRAFLQVQNGCDHRCTFCVIPLGRGRSRSLPVPEAVVQARALVDGGARELVLTGVDLTSYGSDLGDGVSLGRLVGALLRSLPELDRLRLSSLDAVEIDDALRDLIATEPRLMPHLHLSLQAGDDMILKRMKRRHTRAASLAFCREMRILRPGIAFGADLIAGFPTEDEAMAARTRDLVAECGLSYVHVFPYSPRPGTPAARMPQLAPRLVAERATRLREQADAAYRRHLDARRGQRLAVLTERGGTGRAEDFTRIRFAAPVEPGRIVNVEPTDHDGKALLAA